MGVDYFHRMRFMSNRVVMSCMISYELYDFSMLSSIDDKLMLKLCSSMLL